MASQLDTLRKLVAMISIISKTTGVCAKCLMCCVQFHRHGSLVGIKFLLRRHGSHEK